MLNRAREAMPELPWDKEKRYEEEWGLTAADAVLLAESLPEALYFEECVERGAAPVRAANWVRTEVFRVMNELGIAIGDFPVKPASLAELVNLVEAGKLSTTVAREVFSLMAGGRSMAEAMEVAGASPGGLSEGAVEAMVSKILAENEDAAEAIRSGKDPKGKKLKFLTGLVMKEARGQADAAAVADLVNRLTGAP